MKVALILIETKNYRCSQLTQKQITNIEIDVKIYQKFDEFSNKWLIATVFFSNLHVTLRKSSIDIPIPFNLSSLYKTLLDYYHIATTIGG
jgi:hypothetical protein